MHQGEYNRKRRKWIIILIIISVFIIIRLTLPGVILSYSNKALSRLNGYHGHIDDIDLSIIRGFSAAKGFYLAKIDSITQKQIPFVSFEKGDFSIEWNSLLRGKIVGEISLQHPVVRFTKDKVEPKDIRNDTADFQQILKELIPLKINRFEVQNGKVEYRDSTTSPLVNISIGDIYILARNLANVEDTALLPASVLMNADIYGGKFNLNIKLDPLAASPAFDLNMELENAELKELNDFFKAYANIDVNKGTFSLFAEVAGEDRKFVGYVKPLIKDLDIVGPKDRKDNFLNKLWEGIVSVAGAVFENNEEDQIATKIPISGEYTDPSVGVWYAVLTVLRNAFIQALYPSIDFSINAATVEDLNKKDKKKKESGK